MSKKVQLLDGINSPSDLKKLQPEDLPQVSKELRDFIIDVVSNNPGHFGASLGVVELTVALHYVFNTPYDRLIWDVGHQAYGHKILTGRRDVFHTNRKYGGISGFPNRTESEYDSFGTGHSSTSISAALGMAVAAQQNNEDRQVIAVIGDGSMTGGMAFEGLNNGGMLKTNMLIVLNDNNIAIDKNVGALKEYLVDITTSQTYNKVKKEIWDVLGRVDRFIPRSRNLVQKLENAIKSALIKQSNYFEALGFRYFGPVDGHDVVYLTQILNDLKNIPGPKILHCVTVKGKGFGPAEKNQTLWHAPGVFDKDTGERIICVPEKPIPPRYQDVFGHTLVELAEQNPKIVGITPAMPSGCSLNIMMEKMPNRTFDVGIAEQHAVTFAAGLAAEGKVPFCNVYSSFLQRAYDQVIHDVALQNLHVVLCLDRAGVVGDDGATHHGLYDIASLRAIPGLTICSPMNEEELRNMMYTAQLDGKGPWVIRYPRGNGVMPEWRTPFKAVEVGKGVKLRDGLDLAVLTLGPLGNYAATAIDRLDLEGISVAHYNMRFVKPLDEELLEELVCRYKTIVTIEDGCLKGGFGSAIMEYFCDKAYTNRIVRLGFPDRFIEHGTPAELYRESGLDVEGIYCTLRSIIAPKEVGVIR
jgi:1-deoxy-D-xylulose-5-phosphate synthase